MPVESLDIVAEFITRLDEAATDWGFDLATYVAFSCEMFTEKKQSAITSTLN